MPSVLGGTLILVVEDDPAIQSLLVSCLSDEGYQVATASTGQAAIDLAAEARPDLVLLDMMLPKMDGAQVGRHLFQLYGQSVPIIVVSAAHITDSEEFRRDVGAFAVLSKPFDLGQLLDLVRGGVAEAHRRRSAEG
jgi:CheY-like chemotaxis protein